MSKRIVDNPELHGWVDLGDDKWGWDGQSGGGGLWEENGDDIYYDAGNVGIGGSGSTRRLYVESDQQAVAQLVSTSGVKATLQIGNENSTSYNNQWIGTEGTDLRFATDNQTRLTIDDAGSAAFSGAVHTSTIANKGSGAGIRFGNVNGRKTLRPYDALSDSVSSDIDIGNANTTWGTVFAESFQVWDNSGSSSKKIDLQTNGDATFSGTVNANAFVGDGSGLTGVGGGLPPGDFTHNGTITATDFIATSDELAKDNISTAPVGLIDSLKGREWDWKESGEKGSGVVAQELEQVLPHLVKTDDEGMKSVSYMGLCAYLIEEVKALRAEVEALK